MNIAFAQDVGLFVGTILKLHSMKNENVAHLTVLDVKQEPLAKKNEWMGLFFQYSMFSGLNKSEIGSNQTFFSLVIWLN